jgi:hypothetical protein
MCGASVSLVSMQCKELRFTTQHSQQTQRQEKPKHNSRRRHYIDDAARCVHASKDHRAVVCKCKNAASKTTFNNSSSGFIHRTLTLQEIIVLGVQELSALQPPAILAEYFDKLLVVLSRCRPNWSAAGHICN